MSTLVIPPADPSWPSLGSQVCDLIEADLVFGPGDLRGEPAKIDREKRAVIELAYQVYPRGHRLEGRRRFNRVALYWRKGKAKTELAAWLMGAEMHPDGPVRCDGFRKEGGTWVPVGRPLSDPFIPMLAYTEKQSEELAYGALYAILADSPIADLFDIGLERIIRADGTGRVLPLAASPKAREGSRITSAHVDEPHLFVYDRLRKAHSTVSANLPKRIESDAWMLETGTMFVPGEGSVAESTWDAGQAIAARGARAARDSRLLLIYRGADETHDISTEAGLHAAIVDATGPDAMPWTNVDGIKSQFRQPDADIPHLRKTWLNQAVRSTDQAFDLVAWKSLARPDRLSIPLSWIVLGFDGSRYQDATALIATDVVTGHQWPVGIWERPLGVDEWEVPEDEVDIALDDVMTLHRVWLMLADPAYWESTLGRWQGRYRAERIKPFPSNRARPMAEAVRSYDGAIRRGELSHSGDTQLTAHIGNAHRLYIDARDDEGKHLFLIRKERPNSPHKIDGAAAGVLSWEARTMALKAGIAERAQSSDRAVAVFH